MDIKQALNLLVNRQSLSLTQMQDVMRHLMSGECSAAQIAGFLVALRMKGETLDEVEGAVRVMRELCVPVQLQSLANTVDIVGTGGDGANLFNVSTASTFVVAAAGGKVAKHGNRAVSSKSGSADVLEAAGINLQLTPEQTARCIDSIGVGFMFAVNHHTAMRHVIAPRKELGLRTLFNVLGPLTNPAGVKRQVLGVYDKAWCRPLAEVLGRLGSEHVLVVHAQDGLDELSLATPSYVAELKEGQVTEYLLTPEDVGLKTQSLVGLSVDNVASSLARLQDTLNKRQLTDAQKAADMIALNAGAALYVAGLATTIKQGVTMAEDAIYSGLAFEKLVALRDFSRTFLV
ncbi:MAG: anthranilate phosphoribosyltransferase [Moraxellaceae bacterium]|nr:anthranilate phosphoribosyltransferase [Pseudomonadales bacterium]MCB1674253.1 anthranilate phosphoribosyltransferase [Pseudomonadales bacterium]MCP5175588.1 anthranilate phosphoribosyltransferase [Moraxellaceae bacterium]MCP5177938.1 anthranilate phosphoribosyltransferase [Moraxellaceae bacterium]HQV22530.1 anthranilate phosphoribosyltransferase [Agitococcus sp.]